MAKETINSGSTRAEADRLAALRSYGILDTEREHTFDTIARLAAFVCRTPIALVNFIDADRQWTKGSIGLDIVKMPLNDSVCGSAIQHPGPFVIPDLSQDHRFSNIALVAEEPHLRFYAGVRLETTDGLPLGMLCVFDDTPRADGLTVEQVEMLNALARVVTVHLDLRATTIRTTQREQRLRTIVDAIPQKIWTAHPDGSHEYFNRRWYEFTGTQPEESKGSGWLSVVHPEDRPWVTSQWERSLKTGEDYEVEFRLRHHSGEYRWVLGRAHAGRNKHGRIERWFGASTDINRAKIAEQALTVREQHYRGLIEASAIVVWFAAADGMITYSKGWAEYSGQSEEEYVGIGWLNAVHPDDHGEATAKWQAALSSETFYQAEFRVHHRSGTYRWVLASAVPIRDPGGALREWIGSISDIHNRKQTEERLQASEERLRLAIETTSLGIWDADLKTGHRAWTSEAKAILGIPTDAPVTRDSFLEQVHPEDRATVEASFFSPASTDALHYSGTYRVVRRVSGEERWVTATGRTLLDPEGRPIRKIGTVQDITASKHAEIALRNSEERYRALVTATASILWQADAQGLITQISGFDEYQGPQENLLGYGWLALVHPDDQERLVTEWQAIIASGAPGDSEFRFRGTTDVYRWVICRAAPLTDEDGSVREWVGTLSDIHEKKETETQLILRERSLEAIAQGALITDACLPDNPIIYANPAFERLTGYSADEVLGRNCRFLQGPDTDHRTVTRIRAAIAAGETVQETLANYRKDGTSFINELTVAPVQNRDGNVTHFVGIQSDITERKRLEERLQLALQAGRMVAWEQDLKTNFVKRSPNAISLLGIASCPLSEFLERVHPEDQSLRENLAERVRQEGFGAIEFRYTPPNGRVMWLGARAEKAGANSIVGVYFDITDRKAAEEEIWRVANHDALTGLPNRALFQRRLEEALAAAKHNGTSVTLLLIDFDHFKEINDTLGHDAGDAFLAETASRLKAMTRDCDIVSRFSGDEFAVLIVEPLRLEHVFRLAEIMIEKLGQPFQYLGRSIGSTVSIGLAAFPDHDVVPADLLKDADIALFEAKGQGRNQIVVYCPSLRSAVEQKTSLLREVRDALPKDQIVPFYQPKVCLMTGRIVGFEILARWRHPEQGVLTPAHFGSAFDDPRLALMLSESLLTQAAADLRGWLDAGLNPGRVAFNLSSCEFSQVGLADHVFRILDSVGIPSNHFEIEVTESVLLSRNSERISAILNRFHEKGISIALDDFGTGFASLSHLKQFPVDHVKIDQSFIHNLEQDVEDKAIVTAVIGLGRSLNMLITAEGIETEGQAQCLRELGCHHGQGYLFAKPVGAVEVPQLLSNSGTWNVL
jgi:diguanylate cyclase (GGDEF)-like protein/PAS domain S-box-containing protein